MWPFTRRRKPAPARVTRTDPVLQVRSFKAAKVDRLKASWTISSLSINDIIRRDLPALRARSRQAGENDPYSRRFLSLLRSNVIGPDGVLFQSRVMLPDNSLDRPLNASIERAWRDWCRAEHCDMAGKLGFAEMSRQFVATVAEDGEAIVRLIETNEAGKYGFALQFIDAERLDLRLDRDSSPTQNAIRMGIEIDRWSRPVAYWFNSQEGDYHYAGRAYIRIPAEQIIHGYLPFRAGAWRGLPWSTASLVRLNMLDGYEDAALVNARVGASKMGFFLTEDGQAPMSGADEADGSVTISAEPGEFEALPSTVRDFRTFDPAYPMGEFPTFVKQILRGVSAGLGISYHKLSGDLEAVNFSSGRLGEQDDRDFWKALQNWIINDALHQRVFARWIAQALKRRLIPGARPEDVDLYTQSATWQPRRWAHIQPREEAAAREMALKLRLVSRSSLIRDDGRDPDEVWAEIEAEEQAMRARSIDPTLPDAPPADPTAPTDTPPADPAIAA